MSTAYVQAKVREAVMAAKGSRSVAQQLLTTWAAEDPKLLLGMAQPFLKAIIAAALEGEVRRASGPSRRGAGTGGGEGRLSRDALGQVLSRLGDTPPSSTPRGGSSGGASSGGMTATTISVSSKADAAAGAGGVTHESAMKAIAKAFVAKKL